MDSCSVSQKWTLYLKRHVIKAPSARIHFEKFAFPFHWKWNKSIASTRSFSDHPFTRKRDKWLKTLSTFYCACLKSFLVFGVGPISYPEPSNFLLHMLDENEGLWKGPVLKVRIVLYYISEDQSGSPKNRSFPEPFVFVEHALKEVRRLWVRDWCRPSLIVDWDRDHVTKSLRFQWIRYCCVFKSFHSGEHFQNFAFRVDGTLKHNKIFGFSNKNAFVWRGESE